MWLELLVITCSYRPLCFPSGSFHVSPLHLIGSLQLWISQSSTSSSMGTGACLTRPLPVSAAPLNAPSCYLTVHLVLGDCLPHRLVSIILAKIVAFWVNGEVRYLEGPSCDCKVIKCHSLEPLSKIVKCFLIPGHHSWLPLQSELLGEIGLQYNMCASEGYSMGKES